RFGDATGVHSCVFDGTGQRDGGRSYEVEHRAEYYLELARGFSPTVDRPLWLQEVGAPRSILGESDVPWFLRRTVETALDCPQLWGVSWWCSREVAPELAEVPPLGGRVGLSDYAAVCGRSAGSPGGPVRLRRAPQRRRGRLPRRHRRCPRAGPARPPRAGDRLPRRLGSTAGPKLGGSRRVGVRGLDGRPTGRG